MAVGAGNPRIRHLPRRDPHTCGVARGSWRLAAVLAAVLASCADLRLTTPQSRGRLLARLGIGSQRGRDDVPGPDPDDAAPRGMGCSLWMT